MILGLLLHVTILGWRGQVFTAPLQCGAGDQVCADRSGNKQEHADQHFMQTESLSQRKVQQQPIRIPPIPTWSPWWSMQTGKDIGQAARPMTNQGEAGTQKQENGGEKIDNRGNHSIISPRSRNLASAMVLTNPSRAMSKAASKNSGRPI